MYKCFLFYINRITSFNEEIFNYGGKLIYSLVKCLTFLFSFSFSFSFPLTITTKTTSTSSWCCLVNIRCHPELHRINKLLHLSHLLSEPFTQINYTCLQVKWKFHSRTNFYQQQKIFLNMFYQPSISIQKVIFTSQSTFYTFIFFFLPSKVNFSSLLFISWQTKSEKTTILTHI